MTTLQSTVTLQGSVASGASLVSSETLLHDGQMSLKKNVPNGAVDLELEGLPVTRAGILFLMLKPDSNVSGLTYKVAADTTVYTLDAPHVFRGAGQASFLPVDPANFKFSNSSGQAVVVEIFALFNTTV